MFEFEKNYFKNSNLEKERKIFSEDLENIHMSDEDKVVFILACKNFKPATEVSIEVRENNITDLEDITKFKIMSDKLNLHYVELSQEYKKASPDHVNIKSTVFAVGKRKEDVEKLLFVIEKVIQDPPIHKYNKEFGQIYGFPQTAVEAFDELDKMFFDIPEDIKNKDYMAFCWFALSKEHWQQEIKVAQKWAQTVKDLSPNLYNRIVIKYKNSQ